jgi:hypothetical protein
LNGYTPGTASSIIGLSGWFPEISASVYKGFNLMPSGVIHSKCFGSREGERARERERERERKRERERNQPQCIKISI